MSGDHNLWYWQIWKKQYKWYWTSSEKNSFNMYQTISPALHVWNEQYSTELWTQKALGKLAHRSCWLYKEQPHKSVKGVQMALRIFHWWWYGDVDRGDSQLIPKKILPSFQMSGQMLKFLMAEIISSRNRCCWGLGSMLVSY